MSELMFEEVSAGGKKWYKQYAWKKFIEVLLIFLLVFAVISWPITYFVCIGIYKMPYPKAFTFTMLHLLCALGTLVIDVMRQIANVTAKFYVFGFWCEGENDFWFEASDVEEPMEVPIGNPALNVRFRTLEGDYIEKDATNYNVYYAKFPMLEKPRKIILIPKPYTWEDAFKHHRETLPIRYPIPARVSYAVFVKLLEIEYEGEPLGIYEVRWASGMIADSQRELPWFFRTSKEVPIEVLKGFDRALATAERLKYENLKAFTRSILERYEERGELGIKMAEETLKDFLATLPEERKAIDLGFLSKYKWHILLVVGIIILTFVLWKYVVPMMGGGA